MVKVMTFGAFDVIHDGHRSLFRQAKEIGGKDSKLLVVVASDARIMHFKGKKPWYSQKERMAHVQKEPLVDEVIPGDKVNSLKPILDNKPEIIVFGYDQPMKTAELMEQLVAQGFRPQKIVRAQAYKPHQFKSSKLKKKIRKN
ncbi:MAG: adenylyltransferase/cytidyltransferase family protein [Candidatus Micrarchaeota archaeon]